MLREMGLDPRRDTLYGLYEGVPLSERALGDAPLLPDRITIYYRPLVRDFRTPARSGARSARRSSTSSGTSSASTTTTSRPRATDVRAAAVCRCERIDVALGRPGRRRCGARSSSSASSTRRRCSRRRAARAAVLDASVAGRAGPARRARRRRDGDRAGDARARARLRARPAGAGGGAARGGGGRQRLASRAADVRARAAPAANGDRVGLRADGLGGAGGARRVRPLPRSRRRPTTQARRPALVAALARCCAAAASVWLADSVNTARATLAERAGGARLRGRAVREVRRVGGRPPVWVRLIEATAPMSLLDLRHRDARRQGVAAQTCSIAARRSATTKRTSACATSCGTRAAGERLLSAHLPRADLDRAGQAGDDYVLQGVEVLGADALGEAGLVREFWRRARGLRGHARVVQRPRLRPAGARAAGVAPRLQRAALLRRAQRAARSVSAATCDLYDWLSNHGAARLRGGLDLVAKLIGLPGKGDVVRRRRAACSGSAAAGRTSIATAATTCYRRTSSCCASSSCAAR